MRKSDFHFDLPSELIAQTPPEQRGESRLLDLSSATPWVDRQFSEITQLLHPNDLLIFNDTRVIPARLMGRKESGGRVELLVERVTGDHQLLAHIRASKAPRSGTRLLLEGELHAEVCGRAGALFEVRLEDSRLAMEWLEAVGRVPLPPYIERQAETMDRERYQTIYARNKGAVAAPTAGLHFTQPLLNELESAGVRFGFVTLHVGAGTFQPVRVEQIEEHSMHSEWYEVSESLCEQVERTREAGGRVVAVGTTAVRSLESASSSGRLRPFQGETDIFITPGYRFKTVDAMVTNFHLSESTLIMLVTAFAGYEQIMGGYQHAIEQRYRFFSYGDAMFITRSGERG
ncbi:MAG: tRNA preQ1(34) S-adenosylmethionine ribosyltransferase-isomerase QueA [Gammaproteobacteria bacterium]|jgi:S-adenosylmethionine:tRNA ribosyltransferase-isomerase|nr:tRNA preQ1(34) S-adenosylmethionine ribosyltransferase-isomerase QueA [Gammaproteobacteria bacterium]